MVIDWQAILTQLGSTAIIVAALAFVTKKVVEHWLAQRLQSHKQTLDAAAHEAIERLRSELGVAEAQRSRLLERQAVIVSGVFARLERLHEALDALAAPVRHSEAGAVPLRDSAVQAFNSFTKYYHERGIWLDEEICDQLNQLMILLGGLLTKLNYNLQSDGSIADRRRWIESYDKLKEEVPKARTALDKQFRQILGVSVGILTEPVAPAS
jgi:predicted NBD/HSP70 family sugar kinase